MLLLKECPIKSWLSKISQRFPSFGFTFKPSFRMKKDDVVTEMLFFTEPSAHSGKQPNLVNSHWTTYSSSVLSSHNRMLQNINFLYDIYWKITAATVRLSVLNILDHDPCPSKILHHDPWYLILVPQQFLIMILDNDPCSTKSSHRCNNDKTDLSVREFMGKTMARNLKWFSTIVNGF